MTKIHTEPYMPEDTPASADPRQHIQYVNADVERSEVMLIAYDDRVVMRIGIDGTISFGDHLTPDEAGRQAWKALMGLRDHHCAGLAGNAAEARAGKVKPLVWVMEEGRDPDYPKWSAETGLGKTYFVFRAWWGAQNKWAFIGPNGYHDTEADAKAAAQADYEARILSALQPGDGWQDISSAPKDGSLVDLWGRDAFGGRRVTNVSWGRVTDWLGNERDDWQHYHTEDYEPTHWMPLPTPPSALSQEGGA